MWTYVSLAQVWTYESAQRFHHHGVGWDSWIGKGAFDGSAPAMTLVDNQKQPIIYRSDT